jgi:hypothetical protein
MSECHSLNEMVLIINECTRRFLCEILTFHCIYDNWKLCRKLFSLVYSPQTVKLPVIWNGVVSQACEIGSSARHPLYMKFSNRLRS